jgi:hypothetical protein
LLNASAFKLAGANSQVKLHHRGEEIRTFEKQGSGLTATAGAFKEDRELAAI